jgi:hypothetical protein
MKPRIYLIALICAAIIFVMGATVATATTTAPAPEKTTKLAVMTFQEIDEPIDLVGYTSFQSFAIAILSTGHDHDVGTQDHCSLINTETVDHKKTIAGSDNVAFNQNVKNFDQNFDQIAKKSSQEETGCENVEQNTTAGTTSAAAMNEASYIGMYDPGRTVVMASFSGLMTNYEVTSGTAIIVMTTSDMTNMVTTYTLSDDDVKRVFSVDLHEVTGNALTG